MLQLVMAIACACGLFLLAGATRYHGWFLPDQVCTYCATLCDNPGALATIGTALVLAAAVRRIVQN